MRKDCYVSSVNLLDVCAYSYILVDNKEKENKIEEAKTGEFYIRRPNKACMYVTDLITQHNKDSEVIFHFDTPEAYDYVTQMRNIKANYPVKSIKSEYQELNQQLLKEYVKSNYNRLLPILEKTLKER